MSSARRGGRLALTIGYLALAGGVVAAVRTPPNGYELSIYAATPLLFWVGLGVAFLAATVGFARSVPDVDRVAAATLVLLAGVALVGLPLLRGYYYFGAGDAMTHLGWTRELADGALSPWGLLYPGLHELAVAFGVVAERSYRRTVGYSVLVFLTLFLCSLPLCVRLLADRRDGLLLGAFVAVLLVPFNLVSTHLVAHTSSEAIAFSPFVLLLLLTYLGVGGSAAVRNRPTGVGFLLALSTVAVTLVHPQQAANLLVLFVTVAGVQWLVRQVTPDGIVASQRPLYVQAALFLAVFSLWTPRFDRTGRNLSAMLTNVLYRGGGTEVVSEKSSSLTAVGGSIPELFVKLFLVDVVLSVLAGLLMLGAFLGLLSDADTHRNLLVRYLGLAMVPLSVLFALVYVAGPDDMYFRYQGLLMVPVSILGGVLLARAVGPRGLGVDHPRIVPVVLAVFLVLTLPLGVAAAFNSPYGYQPNSQVTDREFAGYERTFETRDPEVQLTGVRSGPRRHIDAYYGTERASTVLSFPGSEDSVTGSQFDGGLGCRFQETRYLIVGESTFEREVVLFDEFRYSREGFRRLRTDPGANRVVDNGGFELYYLYGVEDDPAAVCEGEGEGDGEVPLGDYDRPPTASGGQRHGR